MPRHISTKKKQLPINKKNTNIKLQLQFNNNKVIGLVDRLFIHSIPFNHLLIHVFLARYALFGDVVRNGSSC